MASLNDTVSPRAKVSRTRLASCILAESIQRFYNRLVLASSASRLSVIFLSAGSWTAVSSFFEKGTPDTRGSRCPGSTTAHPLGEHHHKACPGIGHSKTGLCRFSGVSSYQSSVMSHLFGKGLRWSVPWAVNALSRQRFAEQTGWWKELACSQPKELRRAWDSPCTQGRFRQVAT